MHASIHTMIGTYKIGKAKTYNGVMNYLGLVGHE
jgi:hypothetical protein